VVAHLRAQNSRFSPFVIWVPFCLGFWQNQGFVIVAQLEGFGQERFHPSHIGGPTYDRQDPVPNQPLKAYPNC
jgi:hypothetical protein